ncbi:hypothetical protein [Streptomyces collinus]|uniref:hypothetical protein n=1 Tax=Streptomyces collinus TaxID=42684 RepID=UPI003318B43D
MTAVVAAFVGGCSSNAGHRGAAVSPATAGSTRSSVKGLTAAQLAAVLPRRGGLPGYKVYTSPQLKPDNKPDPSVRPAVCGPLVNADGGVFPDAEASAWVKVEVKTAVPPDERITFSSFRPHTAAAYMTTLGQALDACQSLSLRSYFGNRTRLAVQRVPSPAVGDAAVSFRTVWLQVDDSDGSKIEWNTLVTTVREGDATATVAMTSSFALRLPAAKQKEFTPEPDKKLLAREVAALHKAQHSS